MTLSKRTAPVAADRRLSASCAAQSPASALADLPQRQRHGRSPAVTDFTLPDLAGRPHSLERLARQG
ncbi:MAG: hypothetical protein MZV65_37555 [Chromatiales bacterium]|nr:hypothetical protein [Chromatiales bacterium]